MRRRSTRLVSPAVDALRQIESWPAEIAAAGVATAQGVVAEHGNATDRLGWGSVTKLLTAYATLIAAEEGAVDLDEPAGPEGSTVRHLLAHASGLAWDSSQPLNQPGERRIYSNAGLRRARRTRRGADGDAVRHVSRRGGPRPARARGGARGRCGRRHGRERSATCSGSAGRLLAPTLIAPETLAEATTVQFPGLDGVLPGFGRQTPERLGARLRAARREGAALDGVAELTADVRPLRLQARDGDVSLGRPGAANSSAPRWRTSRSDHGRAAAWPALSDAVLSEGSRAAAR